MNKVKIDFWVAMNAKRLRLLHHLTQKDVAKILFIHTQSYNNRENMRISFTDDEIEKLAQLYKVRISRFYKPCVMPSEKRKNSIIYKSDEAAKEAQRITSKIAILQKELERLKFMQENREVYW